MHCEVIISSSFLHDVVGFYDSNWLVEIEQEKKIIKGRL